MALTPLVMANGKTPQNFPATKGEFEHLTSKYCVMGPLAELTVIVR